MVTDHKPLTFALSVSSDKYTPRQIRHLDCISQFTTDIRHIAGHNNPVADALLRNAVNALHSVQLTPVDLHVMAQAQSEDSELQALQNSSSTSLRLTALPLPDSFYTIVCDMSTGSPRPFVPASLHRTVFTALHSLSHPRVQATQQLITERFVWPGMKNIKTWTRTCLPCQQSKVQRHTTTHSPLSKLRTHDSIRSTLTLWDPCPHRRDRVTCLPTLIASPGGQRHSPCQILQQKQWPAHLPQDGLHVSGYHLPLPQIGDDSLSRDYGLNSFRVWAVNIYALLLITQ